MLTNISLTKRKDVTVMTKPTHDIVASDENYGNKTVVGAMWTKIAKDTSGNDYKFLSGSLQKPRIYEGKEYEGYVIITKKEYDKLKANTGEVDSSEVPEIPSMDIDL